MIVLRMSGGLGNQMFQYAFYVKLRSLGREAVFDDYTQYDEETFRDSPQKRRPKRLGIFGIDYPVVSKEDLLRITDAAMDPISRIRRRIRGRKSLEKDDQDFIYDPTFLAAEEGYFCGNFQSARYFAGAEEEVRKAFTFPEDILTRSVCDASGANGAEERILARAAACAHRILEANERYDRSGKASFRRDLFLGGSASIHLRFGDYLDKQEIYGGICTDAYYNAAIERLTALDPDITFFVFSNDRARAGEWVRLQAEKEENRGRSRFVLVKGNDEDHGYLDLYLMSRCRNHIIANSSFSWWGAWLCDNPGKITFAPSIWNNQADGSELRRMDIYDRGMRRINPQGNEIGEEPLISVIMAAYNVAPYAKRAVNSVLTQTYRNLELIAVDDGSTDGTGDILDQCAAQDTRVRVLHRTNGGVSAARNEGLRAARGEYIGFVDGDDAADPQMYECMVQGMLESGADLCTVKYREVPGMPSADAAPQKARGAQSDAEEGAGEAQAARERTAAQAGEPGRQDVTGRVRMRGVVWSRRKAIRAYIHSGMEGADSEVVFHSAVWSKLFRREILSGIEFPEGTSAEDIPFTTGALCRAERVLYLPEVLYDYTARRTDSLMTSRRAQRTLSEEIPAWQTHLAMLREIGEEDLAEESEWYYYRRLLAYEEEYRRCPDTGPEARQLQERILADRDRIRALMEGTRYGRRGDRIRLRLYIAHPSLYFALSRAYEKTIVAWRSR